ncbi:hypothetical protein [Nocardioides pelophilus]|uniref:hypothetical protein n=1 Tax=Nocardioides pelophilus TaxID=2172019 RepID=UPI001601DF04|nr:hypothetical protein [Nocardioides pelophilus]
MPEKRTLLVVIGVVVAVAVVAFVLVRGADDDEDGGADAGAGAAASTSSPTLVPDEEWCVGWQQLVVVQGQYVATQSAADAEAVLAAVDDLQGRGVPESLDPSGYQELNAVLDDVRASVDPTFTPSVVPSEPADVAVDSDDHGDDEHGDDEHGDDEHGDDEHGEDEPHGADPAAAPFGAWLAEYCAV